MKANSESNPPRPEADPLESRMAQMRVRGAPEALRARVLGMAGGRAPEAVLESGWLDWLFTRVPVGSLAGLAVLVFVVAGNRADHWLNDTPGSTTSIALSRDLIQESREERRDLLQFEALAWLAWSQADAGSPARTSESTRTLNFLPPYDSRRLLPLA